jgi:3-oxoacyl-[acyl-carrier protein] reductase
VRAPVLAPQAAIPHLGWGSRIITIGSAGADRIVGATGTVHFMTKSALQSFTRGLAQELGPRDITANLVQPGSTDTDISPADGEYADFQRSLGPLGRYGSAEDVAAAVVFLASPAAPSRHRRHPECRRRADCLKSDRHEPTSTLLATVGAEAERDRRGATRRA